MSKSVLITGAAGFIGSHLTERCLRLGYRVTALDAFTDYYDPSLKRANIGGPAAHPNCSVVAGDLLELDLQPLLKEVSVVFHLAAQPGVRTSWSSFPQYTRANIDVTQRLLQAASETSLERFVLASSSSIYGDAMTLPTREDAPPRPVSPYGVTKLTAEHLGHVYWRAFGVPTVALRYFTVFGPRQRPDMAFNRLITRVLRGENFELFGDGNQTRDFTFVADAVSGTLAAAERGEPGSVYNIGGGSSRSMNDVCDALAALVGTPVRPIRREPQAGDARHTAADVSRARHDLGFEPSVAFEAGLEAQLEWHRAGEPVNESMLAAR